MNWPIASTNPKTIGDWFIEMVDRIASSRTYSYQNIRIQIYPHTRDEVAALGNRSEFRLTRKDMDLLASIFGVASAKLPEDEESSANRG